MTPLKGRAAVKTQSVVVLLYKLSERGVSKFKLAVCQQSVIELDSLMAGIVKISPSPIWHSQNNFFSL